MKKTITELWYGNLRPYEEAGKNNEKIKDLLGRMDECHKKLEGLLSKECYEVFAEYERCMDEYLMSALEEAFSDGFSLGGRIVAEMFSDDTAE